MSRRTPRSHCTDTRLPYTTLFRSLIAPVLLAASALCAGLLDLQGRSAALLNLKIGQAIAVLRPRQPVRVAGLRRRHHVAVAILRQARLIILAILHQRKRVRLPRLTDHRGIIYRPVVRLRNTLLIFVPYQAKAVDLGALPARP